jgi:hypothetical protein
MNPGPSFSSIAPDRQAICRCVNADVAAALPIFKRLWLFAIQLGSMGYIAIALSLNG